MKREYEEYNEIAYATDRAYVPMFPDVCPVCDAMRIGTKGERETKSVYYACGGSYTPKPQIQTHHDVWWGACGGRQRDMERALNVFIKNEEISAWLAQHDPMALRQAREALE